jgi:hypothetical protein
MPYMVDASDILAVLTPREVKDAFRDARDKVKKAWSEGRREISPESPKVRHE